MNKPILAFGALLAAFGAFDCVATESCATASEGPVSPSMAKAAISWGPSFDLPPLDGRRNPGVARPFAGVSNGRVLLAGGANFPNRPLAAGGLKVYHDDVWSLDTAADEPRWEFVGRLPVPWAEGGSAVTPKGVACVSGVVGSDGAAKTNGCFLMAWEGGRVVFRSLPPFAEAASYAAAAACGTTVYGVGTRRVAALDVAARSPAWRPLPDLPEEVFQPAAAVQTVDGRPRLFVFAEHGAEQASGGWSIDLDRADAAWASVPDVAPSTGQSDRRFVGALALPHGDRQILFFGGTSRAVARASEGRSKSWYLGHPNDWFRMARSILVYDAPTASWSVLGETPFAGRCGSAVVALPGGRVLVSGGEIAPGIRTPAGAIGTFTPAR